MQYHSDQRHNVPHHPLASSLLHLMPDDLLFMWLVLLNEYTTTVPSVANTAKGIDLPSLQCMMQHCAPQIFACVTDPQCKAGLDCLQAAAFNDQVCSLLAMMLCICIYLSSTG